jgi:hypothetical protein
MMRRVGIRIIVLLSLIVLALPAAPALGQSATATATIWIDSPAEGATISSDAPIDVGGWAIDTAGPGTGVDQVQVYVDGRMDDGGTLAGRASYGSSRPDVAGVFGSAAYTTAGYDTPWTPSGLSAGQHTLYVYAHSVANGWTYKAVSVTVIPPPPSQPAPPNNSNPYPGGGAGPYSPAPYNQPPYGGMSPNPGGYPGGGYGPCMGMSCGGGYPGPRMMMR